MHIRPTQVIIDLCAVGANLRQVRAMAPQAHICAVVKANAYGHGMVPMALALEAAGVDAFGVALVEEGITLREAGIKQPILVWAGQFDAVTPRGFASVVAHGLTPVLQDVQQIAALAEAADGAPVAVHLEVDTGMARLGLDPADLPAFAQALMQHPNIGLVGLMGHLAVADVTGAAFNDVQWQRLQACQQVLSAHGLLPAMVHTANSPATVSLPHLQLSLVRCGLMLYGLEPMIDTTTLALQPALRWTSQIVAARDLPAGAPVSYGCRWHTQRPSRIGTLPVGYADGYTRRLSGRAHVLVRGTAAPVVGTICMDYCMVDLTEIPNAAVGDEVVLVGSQGERAIGVDDLARWTDTITYEILCALAARVHRHYVGSPV